MDYTKTLHPGNPRYHSAACIDAQKKGQQGTDCLLCHDRFIRAMNQVAREKSKKGK